MSSVALPESPTSKEIGTYLEVIVSDRLGFEHVEDDAAGYLDARTPTGDPVDVKSARYRIANGDTTRRGHWWIQRDNHHALVEAGGFYALAVYRRERTDVDVVHLAVLPARILDAVISTWTAVGDDHVSDAPSAARVPWSRIFGTDGGESS